MGKVIITVPIMAADGFTDTTTGEIVDVAPQLANVATFVVGHSDDKGWFVTNIETGLYVGGLFHGSKRDAIKAATEECKWKTEKDFERGVKWAKIIIKGLS